jgi:type VI protein secretion system component Hcp
MKLSKITALLVVVMLAVSSAAAQTQQAQPQQMPQQGPKMPRTDTPIMTGETLNVARPLALIRIDGVRGESQSRPGWIDALSLTVTCGGAQTAQAGKESQAGGVAGGSQRPQVLTFTHRVDSASPALFDAAASGKRFRTAEVEQLTTKWKLEYVEVTRVTKEVLGTNRATETITLSFGQCSQR